MAWLDEARTQHAAMWPPTLDEVLCATQLVPAAMALASSTAKPAQICALVLLVLDLLVGFGHFIGIELRDPMIWICGLALAGLGIAVAVQVKRPGLASLLVLTGVLEALLHLKLVRG